MYLPGLHVAVVISSLLIVGSGLGSGDEVGADSCKLPNGVFPDPDSCKVFIRCQSGEPEVELCSDGLLFNPFKMTCDFNKTGNCSEPNDFEPQSKIETDDVVCSEDGPNIYPIQSSCTEYYVCENNTAFKVKCSDGLLMNSEMLTCDLPKNIECDIVSSTEESTVGIKAIYGNDKEPEIDSTLSDINKSSAQSAETTTEINSETVYDKIVSEGPDRNLRTILDATESNLPDSSLSNSEGTIEGNVTKTSSTANFTYISTSKPGLDQTTNVLFMSTMPVENKSVSSISDTETNFDFPTTEKINENYIATSSPVTGTNLPFKPFDDNDSSGSLEQNMTSDEDETTIQTSNKDATKVNSGSDVDIIDIFTTSSLNESQQLTQENKFTDSSFGDFKIVSTTLNDKNNVFTKSTDDETWTSDTFSKTLDSEIETVYSTANLSTDATKIITQTTKSEFRPEDYELTSQTDIPNDTTILELDLITIGQNSKSTTSNLALISETFVNKENESNLQTTTQSYTTFIEKDSKITPGRTLGTIQSLMSSDPLTDNETSKYTTSTYSETKISPSHFIETTTATVQNHSNTETAQMNTSTLHSEITERYETSTKVFTENDSESTNDFPPETFVSGESSLDPLSTDISRKISTVNATFDENYEKQSTASSEFLTTSVSESETVSNFITEDATVETVTLSKYTSENATETQNFISSENESLAQTDNATSSDTHFDKISSSTSNWDANETSNSYFFNSTVTNKILDKNETSMETFEEDNYTTPTRTSEYFDAYSTASETQMNKSSPIFEDSTTETRTLIVTGSQLNSVSETGEILVSTEKPKVSSTINLSNLTETSNFRNSTTVETLDFTETSKNDFPLLSSSTYVENVTNSNPQITNSELISTLTHEIKPHTETFETTNTSNFGLTTVISLDNQTDHVDKGDTDSLLTSDLGDSEKFTGETETISNTKHSEKTQSEITVPFSRSDPIIINTGDPSLPYSSQMTSVRDYEELTTQNSESTDDFERKTLSTVHVTNLDYVNSTETDGSPNSSFETSNNDDLASTLPNEISETNLNTTSSTTVSVDNTDTHINTMSSENKINFETTPALLKTETATQSESILKSTDTTKNYESTYSLHTSTMENDQEAYKTDISNNKHESSKLNFVTDSVHNTTVNVRDNTTVQEIFKTDNQKDPIFYLTTTQKDFTVPSKISEIPPISALDLNSNETSPSGSTKDGETELFTNKLETERVTSAQSLDLTNTENMLETSPYSEIGSENENDYSKNASISNNGQSTTTNSTYFTDSQEASTSKTSHTSEYGHTVKVSPEMEITNETLDPFWPKTEYSTAIENLTSKIDTIVASTLVSNAIIQNITSSDAITNKMTDLVYETNEMLSTVSDANHSFESTFNIPVSSKQTDKSSSLELVTSEISTLTDLTLPHKYVNDSVTDINSTTDEIESQSETMGNIAETSSIVVSPTSFPSNENITFNPIKYETDAKEILITSTSEYETSAKDAVSSTIEFITTKFNTENINTSKTSRITARNFDKSTLSTQPNFDNFSSVTTSIDLNTEADADSQTTSSFTSEDIISDFNSSHIATESTKKISDSTQTIKHRTSKPETTHEKLFPSPDNLVSQRDLLEKSTPNSSEGTYETASNGITEKIKSTTNVSPSINELYSKDTDLSTLDTTEEIHSSASPLTIPDTKAFSTKIETSVPYEDRTDSLSKSESSSEFTEIFSTEYSRKSTNRKPLTESLVTVITGNENSPTATSRIYETTDIFDDVSESSKTNTGSTTIGETIPENPKETEYVSSTTHSAITETSVTTQLPKDISENNIHTVSTTQILNILNNDTTETTAMNFDYLNVSITSRNLEEKTDENTEQPSIGSFPVSLPTEMTDSSSSTVTEKEHNGKSLTDEISTIKTTLDPICVSSEGNFPYPGDCNQFYQCIKGIPQISSCVGDEHFDPVKRICTNPCLAKCDPNADCGTTESTTNGIELTSENAFSTTDSGSIETSIDYTTEKVPFTKETTLDKLSTLTSEKTSTAAISVSQSTLETTFRENWTDQLTSLGLSSTVADMNVTNDPTETIWNDFTNSTSTEKSRTELDLSSTSTDVAITSTTENHEIATEEQTEMSRITTFSPEETSKEIVYESSVSPRTTDMKSTSDWSGSGEDGINTSSSWSTLTECEDAECSSDLSTSATVMPLRLCKRNDFLSQPNCNEYLDCTNDVPIKLECPNGLHFNPTTRVCDWPYKAECGMLPKPLFEPTNSITCPCKSCLLPSTTSCSEYYLCLGYTAYKMNCSASLNFDRSRNTCNYAPLVDCNELISSSPSATETTEGYTKTSTTEITTSTTKSTASPFVCPSREGLFRYPGNCEMFYQCSNWYPYPMRCAATTHFSEITQRCEYPCDAKCDLTLNCGSPSTASPSDPRCSCINCKLPSSESCTKYIVCVKGKARIEYCPWGQTFDVKRSTCDWAHKVACHHSAICPERNGIFPHKDDCRKFVHCSNGIPYTKKCPYTLEFDPVKKRCEWPSGRCNDLPLMAKELDTSKREEEKRTGWRCPKTFGYFSHEKYCNKFYHCSFGTPALKECTPGLLYNSRYQTCDWEKKVRCNANRHQKPRRCRVYDHHAVCPDNRIPLPHVLCNMYYDCTAGRACAKQCPIGLYFNNATGLCDLPVNVMCFNPGKEEYSLKELSYKCDSGFEGRIVNPTNDACFYHCRHGKVVSGCCSKGQVYNFHKDKCERRTMYFKI